MRRAGGRGTEEAGASRNKAKAIIGAKSMGARCTGTSRAGAKCIVRKCRRTKCLVGKSRIAKRMVGKGRRANLQGVDAA